MTIHSQLSLLDLLARDQPIIEVEKKIDEAERIKRGLEWFIGSQTWYRFNALCRNDVLTEGTKYLADEAGAYWLMELISSHQRNRKVRVHEKQFWKLKKKHNGAVATCDCGDGKILVKQEIEWTNFPLDEITLYACRNEIGGITIMLPGEY